MERAKSSNESRKMMKHFKKSHKDLNKGDDPRSNQHVVKMKKKKMMDKIKKNNAKDRKDPNKKYGDK